MGMNKTRIEEIADILDEEVANVDTVSYLIAEAANLLPFPGTKPESKEAYIFLNYTRHRVEHLLNAASAILNKTMPVMDDCTQGLVKIKTRQMEVIV